MNLNILLTGATGLVGTALVSRFRAQGHRVVPLRRAAGGGETEATWNPESRRVQLPAAATFDAVIHLAGESIAQRWTSGARARIRASRDSPCRRVELGRTYPQPLVSHAVAREVALEAFARLGSSEACP